MKYCTNCGNPCEDDAAFCTVCGSKFSVFASSGEYTDKSSEAGNDSYTQGQTTADKVSDAFKNTTDTTADFQTDDIEANKVYAILSYFGILFLVGLVLAPNSKFARFHANQGIVLFIFVAVASIICSVPILGWIVGGVMELMSLVLFGIGLVNAINGRAKELPFIGKIQILK